jgi:O-antigen/teichoic acid export membrane protein
VGTASRTDGEGAFDLKPFDASGAFRMRVGEGGLRRLAVRGAGVTMLSQGVVFLMQVVSTVVLARLLMPADFGLVAMVTTFSLLLASVGQIGFPEAVLQRDEINHFVASNLFWINAGVALTLTVGFAAAGSLLAKFYGDPRVAHVAVGASLSIFLTSMSVLHLALMQRAMRFPAVSVITVVSRVVSVAVPIALAWRGWGYWALVAGVVAQPLALAIGAWLACPWVPSLPRRAEGTASLVRFALNVNGRWNFDYCTRNLDNFLVGWRFGSAPLGFYKKAYDLFVLPANQLLSLFPVAISTLSRLRHDSVQYRRYFLGGVSVLAFVGMAAGADLTLVSKDLVRLVLGPAWEPSGRIFAIFGPGIGLMLIYGTNGMIHLSLGTPHRWLRWTMVEFTVTAILFLSALHWGPVGIAAAWTVSFWILTIPAFWYAGKPIHFGPAPVIRTIWRYMVASLLAGCTCALIRRGIPSLATVPGWIGALTRMVTISTIFGALYVSAIILLYRSCDPLIQFARVLREMIPAGRPSTRPRIPDATDTGKSDAISLQPLS